MSQALYRKYRSRSLDEVLGQEHITSILARALEKGKIAHAYLLTGPRGVGKTSVARILAHEINGLPYEADSTHLDIIEIDAASNNGVDDIRALREKAQVAPVSAAKKIYIIDEVHMLSKPAFNALLKTLEEPPAHIVFILATTDADKLPATILSRVQQFYFRPIATPVIASHLMTIAQQEGFLLDEAAAQMIAEHARGGFRDSISLLDQLSSLASDTEPITEAHVATSLGLAGSDAIHGLLAAHEAGDTAALLQHFDQLERHGASPLVITQQLLMALRPRLQQRPELVHLMRELIEVTKHPHPDLKLLTVFVNAPLTPVPTASVATPAPAPPQKKPTVTPQSTEKSTPPAVKKPTSPAKKSAVTKPTSIDKLTPSAASTPSEFNWQDILDEIKGLSIGTYTFLAKSSAELTDNTLTIYAGSTFAQKKLDDAKNRLIITQALEQSYGSSPDIVIHPGKKPPTDERLAAVADIMGGGEEVKLEDMQ